MSDKHPPLPAWPSELTLDEQAGPAAYITRAKADAIVLGALDRAGFTLDAPLADAPAATRTGRRARHGLRYLAAAAVLAFFSVGSASAAVMWYLGVGSVTTIEAPRATPPVEKRRASARLPKAAPQPVEPAVLPEVVVEAPKHERRAPEDWLEEGNRLRAEKRWAKADEAYSRAFQSGARSQTAYVARVAAAAVRLEHLSDAEGALGLYRSALRQEPHGALGEEILLGIAEAQRALGDTAAERRALERFLAQYPSSALAKQVRERLDAAGAD